MTRIAALLALAALFCAADVQAQHGSWVDDSDPRWDDYLVLRPHMLVVARIDRRGECLAVPMPARVDGDTLRRRKGADWALQVSGDSLTVHLPDRTRGFRRTDTRVLARCLADQSI